MPSRDLLAVPRGRDPSGGSSSTGSCCRDQVEDAFWDGWKAAAEAEREQLGIAWEEDMPEDRAVKLGLDAIKLWFRELVPRLGEPVAAQRKLEYVLAPLLEWSRRR